MQWLKIQGCEVLVSADRLPELKWKKAEQNSFSICGQVKVPTKLVHECWDITACFEEIELACSLRDIIEGCGACNSFECGTALSNGSEAVTSVNKQNNTVGFGGKWEPSLGPFGDVGVWQFASGQLCYPYATDAERLTISFWESPASGTPWTKYVCVVEKNTSIGFPGVTCYRNGVIVAPSVPQTQIKYVDNLDGTCDLLIDSRTNSSQLAEMTIWNSELHVDHLAKLSLSKGEDSKCTEMPFMRAVIKEQDEKLVFITTSSIDEKFINNKIHHEVRFQMCAVNPEFTCIDLLEPEIVN